MLRQRGILESTLRHEVAHVVIDAAGPAVRSGYAKDWRCTSPASRERRRPGRVQCPNDAELLRAVSAGAQREAYGRAERCVRRRIAGGTRWTDVR